MLKLITGIALVIAGFAIALWAGLWWAFVGGIVDIVNALKAPEISAMGVALGALKVVCAGVIGTFAALVPITVGAALVRTA